eukprot:CAMPEP_0198456730 /NCGR_PEP_ID=MMETSP1453-20131121/25776_1 /TAXON_ID=1461543 ORGANISM="Unidentified sp., Strain RCC701" /NCGR_SAMPLE_ID=MMETSP1453 /ASSEMBLY_ACC=CAM_ASM_001118 /LENGTH=43 /DNA_ID= /DNA_START= /DNA_END= /DNA_ORIENTATION=
MTQQNSQINLEAQAHGGAAAGMADAGDMLAARDGEGSPRKPAG